MHRTFSRPLVKDGSKKNLQHDYTALKDMHSTLTALLQDRNYVREEPPNSPEEAWKRLLVGNKRFANGELTEYLLHLAHEVDPARRAELGASQHPFVVVLTCSDSRVAPELIFDQGLGDIFVIRTAGNVPDNVAIGSIEYGVLHLKAHLLVVLGHEKCGAVTATLDHLAAKAEHKDHDHKDKTYIEDIVAGIKPFAQKSFDKFGKDQTKSVHHAVRENVYGVAKGLVHQSKSLSHCVKEGQLKIITAVYDLDSGLVNEI